MLKYQHMSLRAPVIAVRASAAIIAVFAAFLLSVTVPAARAVVGTPPLTAIMTEPTAGAAVSGSVTLGGATNVQVSAASFAFSRAGSSAPPQQIPAVVGGTILTWQATWDASGLPEGGYDLTFTAISDSGTPVTSPPLRVNLTAGGGGAEAPFVATVTLPVAGATLSGSATFAATTSADATSLTFILTPTVGGSSISVAATGAGTAWGATANSAVAANGEYQVVARAFHGGAFTDSTPISVTVFNAAPPELTVTLTLPTAGATLSGNAVLAATTSPSADSANFVIRNSLGAQVATIDASGAGTAWTGAWDTTAVPNGQYVIKAFAVKGETNVGSTSAAVTVSNADAPPAAISVTLVAPTDGTTVQGSVPLTATTSGSADSVTFIVTRSFGDGQSFAISASGAATAWSATWSAGALANGTYAIVAHATKGGVESVSSTANVTLNNPAVGGGAPPVVVATVTSPTAGVTVTGTTTLVAATNIAVNALTFVLRDAANASAPPVATVSATPGSGSVSWSAVVNSATVPDGSYALIARANKDGVFTPSAPVVISVLNAAAETPADEEALTISITTPAAATTLTGIANLSATSNLPLDGLSFVINGGAEPVTIAATGNQTKTVWSVSWDSTSVPNGAYAIRVTFTRAGVSAQGILQSFTVSNASVAVSIASPSSNVDVSGTQEVVVSAIPAATSIGVKITNTQDAAITSTRNATFDAGRQVWVVSWKTSDFKNGTYRLDAKGIGPLGREYLASPVTVRVANDATTVTRAFSVRIAAPRDGVTAVGQLALVAAVEGDVAGVHFFASPDGAGSIVRVDATFDAARRQWVATWRTGSSANATYSVVAVAVNAQNAKTESQRIRVIVANPVREDIIQVPLSVRILEPVDGAAEGVVRFAAATEGAVTDVRVFVRVRGGGADAQVLRTTLDAGRGAWLVPWDSSAVPNGTYEAVAIARDATGREASSGVVSLFVERRAPVPTDEGAVATPPPPGGGPMVSFVRPQDGAVLRGIAVLTASASGVARVGFSIRAADGSAVLNRGAVSALGAWSMTWNTTAVRDGRFLIDVAGFDQGGQRVATAQIAVSVANAVVSPVERVVAVPIDVVREMIREVPSGTVALRIEQLPPVVDGTAKLNDECARNRIPANRCTRWLSLRHGSSDCRSAGILTKEECVSFLKQKAGGEVPECKGRSADACAEEIAKKTVGLLDSAELGRLRDAITPSIGKSFRMRPKPVEGQPVVDDKDPRPSTPDAPEDLARHVPLVSRKPLTLRVHASPAFASSDDKSSHQSVPAVLFIDSDGDGLPDDVERRLRTDPQAVDTDGDGFGDADEVRAGYNPRGRGVLTDGVKLAPIDVAIVSGAPIEHPKSAGLLVDFLNVDDVQMPVTDDGGDVVLRGRANPGDVVTVFVYSYLPVVFTTTAEEDGTWSYELGSSLSDGEHEVYATVTDETGKIKSKSGPLSFFVNEAQAVEESEFFRPEELAETSPLIAAQVQAPVRRFAGWYIGGAAVLILAALVLAYVLFLKPKGGNVPPPAI